MNEDFNNGFNSNSNENGEGASFSPEEKKKHQGFFSKICLAFVAYIAVTEGLALAAGYILGNTAPDLLKSNNFSIIFSFVVQYLIGFPIFCLIMKKIPKSAPEKSKLSLKSFFKYGAVSMAFVFFGNSISMTIMSVIESALGIVSENAVNTILTKTDLLFSILVVGIAGPVVEELMFRKMFVDRLRPYGDALAVFLPALMFGLIHGNLYQFFYAFLLGMIFSYVYLRTGKIVYSTLIHIFINLFCGIFPSYIMSLFDYEEFLNLSLDGTLTEEYIAANALPIVMLAIYSFVTYALTFAGVFFFSRHLRDVKLNKGEIRLSKGENVEIVLFNPGAIAFITICVIFIALNTFAV